MVSGLASTGRVRDWLRRSDPDIMGRSRLWLGISAAAVLVAIAGIFVNGLNLGVEFTGGRQMEYSTTQPVTADEARAAVADAGFPNAVVQSAGQGDISVRTGQIGRAARAARLPSDRNADTRAERRQKRRQSAV